MARRISIFCHDLSRNPVGRILPFARAIERDVEVEILGLLIQNSSVYPPYEGAAVFKTIKVERSWSSVMPALATLASLATGDLIYAAKPVPTTLIPACLAAGCPLEEWLAIHSTLLDSMTEEGPGSHHDEELWFQKRLAEWGQRRTKPLVLDVDDDEWVIPRQIPGIDLQRFIHLLHPPCDRS
jgi:hypothetical protein